MARLSEKPRNFQQLTARRLLAAERDAEEVLEFHLDGLEWDPLTVVILEPFQNPAMGFETKQDDNREGQGD